MKFTRTVHCSDEFAGDTPELLVAEVSDALAARIRALAAEVKRLDVNTITLLDSTPTWYLPDWDQEGESADGMYPVPGAEYTSLDLRILHVSDDDFWWTANLKCAGVLLTCESIGMSELEATT